MFRIVSLLRGQLKANLGKFLLVALLCSRLAAAQLSLETDSVAPQRFVAVHGRKALVMGYASGGLELWSYPLQLVSGYELGFRSPGTTSEIPAPALLRRVIYQPSAINRIYIGPDFIVRETLFVPLNEQAILLTYAIECSHSVDIVVHFKPVLDLMWPASLGGQNTHWDAASSAYILADGTGKYSALIGSPAVVSHDQVLNSAQPGMQPGRLAFAVRGGGQGSHSATVVVAQSVAGSNPAAHMRDLLAAETGFEAEAQSHYTQLLANTVRIQTPDQAVNRQLAWAQIALDQAWVCNPMAGCGLVAGYGPSRGARRPQYAWFFAGDALIAIDALVNTGDYSRAQEALAFIAKYQDARTGMIWHELPQSVDPAVWAASYPYMYVHVDITFHYLITVDHYVAASGDLQFLERNWRGLEAAYRYCQSVLDQQDGLPRIPSTKEGGDEQDRMSEDLGLSISWVKAAAAFGRLAVLSGHASLANEAMGSSERARSSAARRYWDDQHNSWIDGYNASGRAIFRGSDDAMDLVPILDRRRSDFVLDRIASADFQTDWGTRGVAASSPRFNPVSYAGGSVSAAGTARVAAAYWQQHRPAVAFPIWRSLVSWGTLDSMGHMHEVLTGDFYRQQEESVPEQTWSSAAFLSSAVSGLLGLTRDAQANRLQFSPHLPADWDTVSVSNIETAGGRVALTIARVPGGLKLSAQNSGAALTLVYSPEIPLRAQVIGAQLNGKSIHVERELNPQDTHATLSFTLPAGESDCLIRYEGGVSVAAANSAPVLGEASKAIKIISVAYQATSLVVDADMTSDATASTIELRTNEKPLRVQGGKLSLLADGVYGLAIEPSPSSAYRHAEIRVDFAAKQSK